jgi:hypothetical protein
VSDSTGVTADVCLLREVVNTTASRVYPLELMLSKMCTFVDEYHIVFNALVLDEIAVGSAISKLDT